MQLHTASPHQPYEAYRLTHSVPDAARILGVSRSKLWAMIATEGFPVVKVGGRTLVRDADLRAFVASLQPAGMAAA